MLVANAAVVSGSVRTLAGTCRIRPARKRLHAISQVDLAKMPLIE